MTQAQIDIADMQCWLLRLAQKKWGVDPGWCARTFARQGVFDFIAEAYGVLHLSSYESALEDVERYLAARGVPTC